MARLDRFNYANVVLIPKVDGPENGGDFRLIALLKSLLRIISKIPADRLTPSYNYWWMITKVILLLERISWIELWLHKRS